MEQLVSRLRRAKVQANSRLSRGLIAAQSWRRRFAHVLAREEGTALAEYAVALTIAVVAIAGVIALAQSILSRFNAINGAIQGLPGG